MAIIAVLFKAILYEYLCLVSFCIVFQVVMVVQERKRGHRYDIKHFTWVYIFLLYLTLVLGLTGIGNIRDILRYSAMISLNEINLLPFHSISEGIATYIENIILFMPFGFLLPLIWRQFQPPWKVICTGLLFSGAIELSQLFNRRYTDIDDLIMNTLGAFLGWALFCVFQKLFHAKVRKRTENLEQAKFSFLARHEACFYLICAFLGVFFIYDPLLF